MVLDNGDGWEPEDFQLEVVDELFAGAQEVWLDLPEGNGKTTFAGGFALYHCDYTPSASVPMAASSRDQTGVLFDQAAGFVYRTPGLGKRFRVYPGYRRIMGLRTGGRIQVFAADDRTGDGVIPTLPILEELHRHPDFRLYRTWRGKLEKRGGQLLAISTAGAPDSEYEKVKAAVLAEAVEVTREGAHTVARSPDFVLHQHALRQTDDVHDLGLVKSANPFTGVTIEGLRRKHDSPTMHEAHWARFTCGVSMETERAWISREVWDACIGTPQFDDESRVWIGVDIGHAQDSTAVVAVTWVDGKLHVKAKIRTPTPGHRVASADARVDILDLVERFRVMEVPFDPWRFSESAELLEEEGIRMVRFDQHAARMGPASEKLYELIREGRLVHDGDPVLREHILAAVPEETERGVKISKRKSKKRIDAAVALAMAADRAVHAQTAPRAKFEVLL